MAMIPALAPQGRRVGARLHGNLDRLLVYRPLATTCTPGVEILSEVMMRRTVWFGLELSILLLVIPSTCWSHAYLVKSSPARRAVLPGAPARLVLWFNERLEAQFSQVTVWNTQGQQVDRSDVQVDPADAKQLSVGIQTLPAGTYTVKYRVLSVDGHVVESEFSFTVRSQ
jgi:copper resistance protein C